MRYWNIINSYRSITASCSNRISSISASDINSEINISIKQNRINSDLNSFDSLLLNPNSVNANWAKSIASNAKSLASKMSYEVSNHSSYSKSASTLDSVNNASQDGMDKDNIADSNSSFKADKSSASASKSVKNKNYSSVSNSINSLVMKHNQSVVGSVNANQNNLKSHSDSVNDELSKILNQDTNKLSGSNDLDINNIYANELRALNNTELYQSSLNTSGKNTDVAKSDVNVNNTNKSAGFNNDFNPGSKVHSLSSSINSVFNAVAGSTSSNQSNVLHFSDDSNKASNSISNPLNFNSGSVAGIRTSSNSGVKESLNFDKIKSKNVSNSIVHTGNRIHKHGKVYHRKELHGLEHHVKHIQDGSMVNKYMKSFALSIMTVIVTIFLIGVVSYASTLF